MGIYLQPLLGTVLRKLVIPSIQNKPIAGYMIAASDPLRAEV